LALLLILLLILLVRLLWRLVLPWLAFALRLVGVIDWRGRRIIVIVVVVVVLHAVTSKALAIGVARGIRVPALRLVLVLVVLVISVAGIIAGVVTGTIPAATTAAVLELSNSSSIAAASLAGIA
jgi:hypothetical protein